MARGCTSFVGGWLEVVEDKKLPHTGWEIRYEHGVGGLSQAEIGLLWAERLG